MHQSRVAAIAAIAFALSAMQGGPAAANEPTVQVASHTAAIDQFLLKLNIGNRTADSTAGKAVRVRNAIKQGDYAAAGQIAKGVLTESKLQNWRFYPFTDFIRSITDTNDAALEQRLDEWVSRKSDDPLPLLLRAQFHFDIGWFKRGHGFISETGEDRRYGFARHMGKALVDIEDSIRLSDKNPYAYYLKLRILRGLPEPQELENTFAAAIAKYPSYYPLYKAILTMLQPKWGGTIEAMYAFTDQYAGQAAEHSPLKLLYLDLYGTLLETAVGACGSKATRDQRFECVHVAMKANVRPALNTSAMAALQLHRHVDRNEFGLALAEILSVMLSQRDGDGYSGTVLEVAARSLGNDTQPDRVTLGRNDYFIDKLFAQSMHGKGLHEDAIRKGGDALRAIEAATFQSAEERDVARAGIYAMLSDAYFSLNRHVEMVAYQKAAVALGPKTWNEHFICFGYFKLKDYESALRECNLILERHPSNLKARYWRGLVHRDLMRTDAALQDLTAVAESTDGLRTYAALDVSTIHLGRKDNRAALTVLNKHSYLYDPNVNNKSGIALSYNNRCSAYMEIREFRKALDDCNESLKYGNLPDALQRQLDLSKRIKASDIR